MSWSVEYHEDPERNEQKETDLLKEEIKLEREEIRILKDIRRELRPKQLSFVKIAFGGTNMATPVIGPVVLNVGDSTVASLVGFDQTGNPMPAGFVMPATTFAIDNAAIASSTPEADSVHDDVLALTSGVANLSGSVTSAEGLALSDTETVTVSPVVLPPPVLSSVKLAFASATTAAKAAVKR